MFCGACCLVLQVHVSSVTNPLESSIDQAPYVNIAEDGMVSAIGDDPKADGEFLRNKNLVQNENSKGKTSASEEDDHVMVETANVTVEFASASACDSGDIMAPVKKCLNQLSRNNRKTMWLLAYIAIVSSWPVVRSAFLLFFKKKKLLNAHSGTSSIWK